MADLAVVIPSRGRPDQAARLVDQIEQTRSADIDVVVVVDHDEPLIAEYERALAKADALLLRPAAGSRGGHVAAINAGALDALRWQPGPTAIMKLDDDHWPVTPGWDRLMLEALEQLGGVGIVYGNDLLQGERLPTAPMISASIVRTLGWMGPPELQHLYVDNAWLDLGRDTGCLRYLPDVITEHRHVIAGKAPMDEGYERVNAPERYQLEHALYSQWRYGPLGRTAACRKIRALRSIR